ncbi:hypothetical protein HALLA_02400 (plasmid) [Halostagnicola larsenii XH-48]|uniref:Uncharacterized protein n=1 Tax=Halostagnicola larsenii XH-48 TaxID=797299 RepID=W0JW06_9EURY|nr:hypothetical protein [Halostagnicola larsenii]AHG01248.1 hypothetical protein HALLA_02400 [Halostagnicola larsenii XH-48]
MRRRNVLLGIGSVVFASGSFIVSGAFETQADAERGNWVQANRIDGESGGEVSVRTIANPDAMKRRFREDLGDGIGVTRSSVVQADDNGLLRGIEFESVNADSLTRVGRFDGGTVDPSAAAFLIANHSGVDADSGIGQSVELSLRLYDGTPLEESAVVQATDAVAFPYTLPEREQHGELLEEDGVVVAAGETVCVAIELRAGETERYEQIEAVGLTIREPTGE